MDPEISATIEQICQEKDIPYQVVIETIEQALAAAYRKDFGQKNQNLKVEFNPKTLQAKVFDVKTVVENLKEEDEGKEDKEKKKQEEKRKFNPKTEIVLDEAKKIKKDAKIGDVIKTELVVPASYGRMAAQTAKQVIIQKLREAEKESLYKRFKEKEGKVLTGVVQRRENQKVLVDLEKITAILPPFEQIKQETYQPGQRIRIFVLAVNQTTKGPEVIVSRTHPEIVRELFFSEVPEINNGSVEIKGIAREAGSRTKIAVEAKRENIDPIGSCVGQRGARVQTIISELGGEKIDIIQYDEDPIKFISQALSPAKVSAVEIIKKEKTARVKVKKDQYSLAIGKDGQNVRLASNLTGWKLEIVQIEEGEKQEKPKEKKEEKKES